MRASASHLMAGLMFLLCTELLVASESTADGLAMESAQYAVLPAEADRAAAEAAWAAGQFQAPPSSGELPVALMNEALWTRIEWRNPGGEPRQVALEVIDYFEDYAELFVQNAAGDWERHLTGERVRFSQRSLWGREPVFLLTLPPAESLVTWINNANDESHWPLYRLHDPAGDFLKIRRSKDQWTGFYYGALLALVCYNLFVYSVLRLSEVLHFLVYVATFGFGFYLYQGLHSEWFPWLQSPFHNLVVAVFLCGSVIALTQFSRRFLAMEDYPPLLDRWPRVIIRFFASAAVLIVLYAGLIAIDARVWSNAIRIYHGIFPVLALAALVSYAILTIIAFTLLQRGCRQARFYLLGFGALFCFLIPPMIVQITATPTLSDIWWIQIASGLEMLLFAFALADKIRIMRDEKNAAVQQAALESAERSRLERAHEEILRQKAQLVGLHQQKSEFLGIAAHDLKNPLNAVQEIARLLREDEQRPPDARMASPERVVFLAEVAESSQRMLGIIESLFDTEALESGRIQMHCQPHSLADLVDAAWGDLIAAAEAKRISATFRIPADAVVRVDGARFRRVLENLLSNAIKYSVPGGAILLHVVQPSEPGMVTMALHDSGPGFSAEDLPQLFGRYRTLSARPTGGESSTGLGLYIVKRLLELQGGSIEQVSPPGQSAVFKIVVPDASEVLAEQTFTKD